jgi:hypothetical protein
MDMGHTSDAKEPVIKENVRRIRTEESSKISKELIPSKLPSFRVSNIAEKL